MTIITFGSAWFLAGRMLRPLHAITNTARRFSGSTLHERIALKGPRDELKDLADTFDAMLGRLDAAFTAQKEFVANASHELRTPLTIIRTEIDVALADPDVSKQSCRRWEPQSPRRSTAASGSSTACWCWRGPTSLRR